MSGTYNSRTYNALAYNGSGNIALALSGSALAGSIGAVAVNFDVMLSGNSMGTSQGDMVRASLAIVGTSMEISQDSVWLGYFTEHDHSTGFAPHATNAGLTQHGAGATLEPH